MSFTAAACSPSRWMAHSLDQRHSVAQCNQRPRVFHRRPGRDVGGDVDGGTALFGLEGEKFRPVDGAASGGTTDGVAIPSKKRAELSASGGGRQDAGSATAHGSGVGIRHWIVVVVVVVGLLVKLQPIRQGSWKLLLRA